MSIPHGYQPLHGSERHTAVGARRMRAADPQDELSVTIRVRRRPDAPELPDQAYWAAHPPGQRRFIPRDQFAARYGALPAELDQVAAFARGYGMVVEETNAARRTVVVRGKVADVQRLFGVELAHYRSASGEYRGREGAVYVPQELSDIVEGVFGLDNRRMAKRAAYAELDAPLRARPRRRPAIRGDAGGPAQGTPSTVTPPQVAGLYDFPPLPANMSSQTIGLIEFSDPSPDIGKTGYNLSDIQTWFTTNQGIGPGFATPTLIPVPVNGATNSPGGPSDPEVALDIEVAGAVAQGAQIAVYFTTWDENGWVQAITTAVHPNAGQPTPSVISISYDWAEFGSLDNLTWSTMAIDAVSATFQDAAAMGVTILVASGDAGSDCQVGDGKAHVYYPASDPWITCCGGTSIQNLSGSSFTEATWNDNGVTGGGVSDVFGLPFWQEGIGVPPSVNDGTHVGRGIPDIAGQADGYDIFVDGTKLSGVGGTSETAPLYAGLVAILNATLGENVGYLNPTLYALAGTNVFRDIADGGSNATNGAPGYTSVPGWDACTGLGRVDGGALLSVLQQSYVQGCTFVIDRSSVGKLEVDAQLANAATAVIEDAFYVVVEGLTPDDLGLNTGNLGNPPLTPTIGFVPPVPGMSAQLVSLKGEDPSLPARPQRFTFTYQFVFANDSGFPVPPEPDVTPVVMTASITGQVSHVTVQASALIELTGQPDPYMTDGAVSWLSTDLRVFQVSPGNSLPGLPGVSLQGGGGTDALNFINGVVNGFRGLPAANHPFNLISTDENASWLELAQQVNGTAVFNFAVARVRYRATTVDAPDVRVFFRLFQVASTGTEYNPSTSYRTSIQGSQEIPLLGLDSSNDVITVPCFASARVNSSATALTAQPDPLNDHTIAHDPSGAEIDYYFGVWLDINQTDPQFPLQAPAGQPDGPYSSGRVSVQQWMRGQHVCLVAEIRFDPDPIPGGATPSSSDKLAQRNLTVVDSDNPGGPASHRIPQTFEVKPTLATLAADAVPDELMLDWGTVPKSSTATIYWPAVSASEVIDLAGQMYTTHQLAKLDDHTLQMPAAGVTYIPIPRGSDVGFAGLLTLDLPSTVRKGQAFKMVARQITEASARLPSPPSPIQTRPSRRSQAASRKLAEWRRVRSSFQLSIPVKTKPALLAKEERLLSVLRWIGEAIPSGDRWRAVFDRYLDQIAGRVEGFGGDPGLILPSPTGSWGHPHPEPGPHKPDHDSRDRTTGKIAGMIFDQFGDFDGFVLESDEHERTFHSRERAMEALVQRAWAERLRVTVVTRHKHPERPLSIVLLPPPARIEH
jgi:Pro-kumamolisin, activation domain